MNNKLKKVKILNIIKWILLWPILSIIKVAKSSKLPKTTRITIASFMSAFLLIFSIIFIGALTESPNVKNNNANISSKASNIESIKDAENNTSNAKIKNDKETLKTSSRNNQTTTNKVTTTKASNQLSSSMSSLNSNNIPAYTSSPYTVINNNQPNFSKSEITTSTFEKYGDLDNLGRCTVAYACLGQETMPAENEERKAIGSVYPTGWKQGNYNCVENKWLYNRCHLIGYQLSAENANKKNLITGTRYLNTKGMLPFENMVADYLHESPNNRVMYRVTPIFEGNNLLASGVQMEAYSVLDDGGRICFNVYCYNVQPNIHINYKDGSNYLIGDSTTVSNSVKTSIKSTTQPATCASTTASPTVSSTQPQEITYVLNLSNGKYHLSTCSSLPQGANAYYGTFSEIQSKASENGLTLVGCKRCNP